jgi:hypothetical protein
MHVTRLMEHPMSNLIPVVRIEKRSSSCVAKK